jgi:hypothetical protein
MEPWRRPPSNGLSFLGLLACRHINHNIPRLTMRSAPSYHRIGNKVNNWSIFRLPSIALFHLQRTGRPVVCIAIPGDNITAVREHGVSPHQSFKTPRPKGANRLPERWCLAWRGLSGNFCPLRVATRQCLNCLVYPPLFFCFSQLAELGCRRMGRADLSLMAQPSGVAAPGLSHSPTRAPVMRAAVTRTKIMDNIFSRSTIECHFGAPLEGAFPAIEGVGK